MRALNHPIGRWYGVARMRSSKSWRARNAKQSGAQDGSEPFREFFIMRIGQFVGVGGGQNARIVEHAADDLQAGGQSILRESARHARGRLLGQVEWYAERGP